MLIVVVLSTVVSGVSRVSADWAITLASGYLSIDVEVAAQAALCRVVALALQAQG